MAFGLKTLKWDWTCISSVSSRIAGRSVILKLQNIFDLWMQQTRPNKAPKHRIILRL